MKKTLDLYVVSITHSSGDTLTDLFQDKTEATQAFLKLCAMNGAEFKNAIVRHDDYLQIAVGKSKASTIKMSVYEIR